MKKNALAALYEKDGTKKVLSSLISIPVSYTHLTLPTTPYV